MCWLSAFFSLFFQKKVSSLRVKGLQNGTSHVRMSRMINGRRLPTVWIEPTFCIYLDICVQLLSLFIKMQNYYSVCIGPLSFVLALAEWFFFFFSWGILASEILCMFWALRGFDSIETILFARLTDSPFRRKPVSNDPKFWFNGKPWILLSNTLFWYTMQGIIGFCKALKI